MDNSVRIPILYLMLGVLLLVSVVPLYFYGTKVVQINRERLITNERLLQNTITRSLSEDIRHRQSNLRTMLQNLSSAIVVITGGNLGSDNINSPELRALLEQFVTSSADTVAYASVFNAESKGVSAGRVAMDDFTLRELEHAFAAAREGRSYNGQPLAVGNGNTVMVVSAPLTVRGNFLGMIATVVDLSFLTKRLYEVSGGGLVTYVVDRKGRLVAGAAPGFVTGQDMTRLEIVRNFVDLGGNARFVAATNEFTVEEEGKQVTMLGTYSPVAGLEWAVIAQKPRAEAYAGVFEMQRTAKLLALLVVVVSVVISVVAARRITTPLRTLTHSSRAIARGDFSQRVHVKSRTEIGELAATFNLMTDDLERLVDDLKRAAEENRELFLGSIQMLAGAVDEKDPYTRGHSDRVTRYSVLLAQEMGLSEEEVDKIRISALLHDVGKIGIEDRILKKPGALTPDEFEIMKTHTSKGASILRPVAKLKDMLPGIELHHEALDGHGYPHGLKGDQIPLMPRIISVADTFDAMTTNRPYQAAMDAEFVVNRIRSMQGKKFDPVVVDALARVVAAGKLRLRRAATVPAEAMATAGGEGGAAS